MVKSVLALASVPVPILLELRSVANADVQAAGGSHSGGQMETHGPVSGLLTPPRAAAASARQARQGDLVDLAAVGALGGIVFGALLLEFGQPVGDGRFVDVELTTAVKARDG